MPALALLKAAKLHSLSVLRLWVQTLAASLVSDEFLTHGRTRPIERICVGVHWQVERMARLHQVVEVLVRGVLVVEHHVAALLVDNASRWLRTFAANDDGHLILHCGEVTSRGCGCLQLLVAIDQFKWAHALVKTVRFVGSWQIAIITYFLLFILQIYLVLQLKERHDINHLVLVQRARCYRRPCWHDLGTCSPAGRGVLHQDHFLQVRPGWVGVGGHILALAAH